MKTTIGEKVFYSCNYVLLTLLTLSCVLPFLHIIALSLSDIHSIDSGWVTLWPVGFTVQAYDMLLEKTNIMRAFGNSITITLAGVVLSMLFTMLASYPLSKKYLYSRRLFTLLMVFTMIFGGGLIPAYLIVKSLGLVNSYFAIWLPGLVSTYNMLVMKNFFENLPEELEEAARMDGCSEWRLLWQIYLPLSLPMIATLSLFYGVGYWNAFMSVIIYINETSKYNLSVLVQQMIRSQSILQEMNVQVEDQVQLSPESLKAAGIIVMVAPMLAMYPFLQKYFVKGVLIGSVKG